MADGESEIQGGRARLLVPVLVFLGVVSTAIGSLGAPLLPEIVGVYGVSLNASQWTLTISLLVGAMATPVLGRLGDGHRRRQVILLALLAVLAGCVLSALPLGFAWLIVGRGLQGAGLGLVPLAITVARDALAADRATPAIALLGVTTATGIGVGYPIAGLLVEYWGLSSAFWVAAGISALAFLSAAAVLPGSERSLARKTDIVGAILLGGSVTGLLLVLSKGSQWGWGSPRLLILAVGSLALLAVWVTWELRIAQPLVDLQLLRHRSVLAANATMLVAGIGIYPLLSLIARLVQAPTNTGYGFGGSAITAGLMLVPFSAASFAGSKFAVRLAKRSSPEMVVASAAGLMLVAMVNFWLTHSSLWQILVASGVAGLGVGCMFAANPLQIVRGVPAEQTGSAMSFYQVLRSVAFSAGSALSAVVLLTKSADHSTPTSSGYNMAAVLCVGILTVALGLSTGFALVSQSRRESVAAA